MYIRFCIGGEAVQFRCICMHVESDMSNFYLLRSVNCTFSKYDFEFENARRNF